MAISVDWANTKVISVPKSFMTLVQSVPQVIYDLDIDEFRLKLLDLMDNPEGRPWQKIYKHDTESTLEGVVYVRKIAILDPYSITFEDGQYAVNLKGANSNIASKTNVNQVSVRPQNSAGATNNLKDIAESVWDEPLVDHTTANTAGFRELLSAYDKGVHVHTGGSSGSSYPYGTEDNPVATIADGLIIAALYNKKLLHIEGSISVLATDDVSGFTLIADRSLGNSITVIAGATTALTYFENLTVSGVMNGSVRYTTCVMGAISNFDGGAKNSLLTAPIGITGTGANYFTDCDVYITDPNTPVEINVGNTTLNLIRCRGGYKLINKTSTNTLAIDLVGGIITVANSCTAGQVFVGGIAEVVDDSAAGCLVLVKSMSHEAISQNVWDEPLTAAFHNEPTSAGKRLRGLTSMVIRNELCQGPGTGNNQIKLDVDASVLDGAYDPAMVTIIGGTGSGQTRQILDYVGSTRMVTVDRNWRVNPDATSEFAIISHAGREHVNEGLAQGGTTDTITLNTSASSSTNAYVGQVVFIRSGTGEDQGCRIASYDGTTKIATICHDWHIIPDTTSGYVILPTATITKESLGDAVWENTTAVILLNYMAFVKNIEGGRWKIIDNQMLFYKEDNTTEIARFDLFDKDGVPAEQDVYERRVV